MQEVIKKVKTKDGKELEVKIRKAGTEFIIMNHSAFFNDKKGAFFFTIYEKGKEYNIAAYLTEESKEEILKTIKELKDNLVFEIVDDVSDWDGWKIPVKRLKYEGDFLIYDGDIMIREKDIEEFMMENNINRITKKELEPLILEWKRKKTKKLSKEEKERRRRLWDFIYRIEEIEREQDKIYEKEREREKIYEKEFSFEDIIDKKYK